VSVWTGPRDEHWRWDLLTKDEQFVGALPGVTQGRLEFSIFNTVRGGGSLSWSGLVPPDWAQYRVRPFYVASTPEGPIEIPLGTFLMNGPSAKRSDGMTTVDVALYDKLLVLDQVKVQQTYSVSAGTLVTDALRALLSIYPLSVQDSAETLTNALSWPAGTSLLRIANDMLAAANYFSLWADGMGVFRAEKYVAPAYRSVAWDFEDTRAGLYTPDWSDEQDLFEVPNVVILTARTDGDVAAMTSTARNDDPLSPTSTVTRGREIAVFEDNVEATSQAVLDALAYRRLLDLSAKALTIEIDHPQLPIELNDAVAFTNRTREIDRLTVVQSMTMTSAPGASVHTRLLEVRL
jgi:hypothetical protein